MCAHASVSQGHDACFAKLARNPSFSFVMVTGRLLPVLAVIITVCKCHVVYKQVTPQSDLLCLTGLKGPTNYCVTYERHSGVNETAQVAMGC